LVEAEDFSYFSNYPEPNRLLLILRLPTGGRLAEGSATHVTGYIV
jgi:hypothetical protein